MEKINQTITQSLAELNACKNQSNKERNTGRCEKTIAELNSSWKRRNKERTLDDGKKIKQIHRLFLN